MKMIKSIYRVISALGVFFLLTGCSSNSTQIHNNVLDLKLKSSSHFESPL